MHNRVLLVRPNKGTESFKNIKSLDAAQSIVNRCGKTFFNSGYKVVRFMEGVYYDSDNKRHQLKV